MGGIGNWVVGTRQRRWRLQSQGSSLSKLCYQCESDTVRATRSQRTCSPYRVGLTRPPQYHGTAADAKKPRPPRCTGVETEALQSSCSSPLRGLQDNHDHQPQPRVIDPRHLFSSDLFFSIFLVSPETLSVRTVGGISHGRFPDLFPFPF